MADAHQLPELPELPYETSPDQYKHWKLSFDGDIATLAMDVNEDEGRGDYVLKMNSYDIGVDIELSDAIMRLRFEHPEVKTVVITGLKEKIFCAGANIFMLGMSSHPFKVNFCKYTNETRLYIEDASEGSGLKFLAALNGAASGGGYELALACDRILLIDDRNSAVSLPEVPFLGVLPGTGGLTRVTDKRKVRRDRADFFCSVAEGLKGKRAKEWKLVDDVYAKSKWDEGVQKHAQELAAMSDRPGGDGVKLESIDPEKDGNTWIYKYVTVVLDEKSRTADLTISAPTDKQPESAEKMRARGSELWALRAFRELDDAIVRLRFNHVDLGLINLRTTGDKERLLEADGYLLANATGDKPDWFAREVLLNMQRVLKRLDYTSRTLLGLVEPNSCFVGCLAETLWATDRSYMLDDADAESEAEIVLDAMNDGPLKMGNGLTRLETRFYGWDDELKAIRSHIPENKPIGPADADELGAVTFVRDEIDYPDEVRLFVEERTSLSPDALVGLEANIRWPGPETMETRIFGRLSAWQNWIFTRPNATGEKGALTNYGSPTRPEFDFRRC